MSKESIASSISSVLKGAGRVFRLPFRRVLDRESRSEEREERAAGNPASGGDRATESAGASARSVPPDGRLVSAAEREILDYERQNRVLFERAERYDTKSERLLESGTPSEIARNRAERARQEIAAGLQALRASFVRRNGEGAEAAFDTSLRSRHLDLPGT